MNRASNLDIVNDIKRVAKKLGKSELSRSEYVSNGGQFTTYQIYDGGRTWEDWWCQAGISTKAKELVPDEVYIERLKVAVQKLGRTPKVSESKKFGLNFSKRRYPTLKAFINWAEKSGKIARSLESSLREEGSERIEVGIQANTSAESLIDQPKQEDTRPIPPSPANTERKKWERTNIYGFPHAPQDESGVVAIFSILCGREALPWEILELKGGKGIGATCWDHDSKAEIRVELKHTLARGGWNHKVEDIDYVVCCENRWPNFPKSVVVLRDKVRQILLMQQENPEVQTA